MAHEDWPEWEDDKPVPLTIVTSGRTPTPYVWTDPTTIPRREWLYGRHLIRRYVSATVAPGGLGKSSLVIVEALAMVSHKPILEERLHSAEPLRVWYWNGEDPNDEAARRIQAAAIEHGLTADDIADRLFVDSGRQMRLKLASMARGEVVLDEDLFEEIETGLKVRNIDVWTLDPFISAHILPENDNGAMDAVIKRLGIVAERANCAIELVHHVRKPANADAVTDVSDARGATAIIGGVRSARVLNPMSKDIAEVAKIDPRERFSYFSVTNGKSNMGPRSDVGLWRQIKSIDLNNGGMALDSSDHVGVVTPFHLPDAMDMIPPNAADIAQDVARVNDMTRYSPKSPEWFGNYVGPALGVNIAEKGGQNLLKTLIDKWLENGILAKRMGEDAKRNKREFICLPDDADPYAASVTIPTEVDPNDLPF